MAGDAAEEYFGAGWEPAALPAPAATSTATSTATTTPAPAPPARDMAAEVRQILAGQLASARSPSPKPRPTTWCALAEGPVPVFHGGDGRATPDHPGECWYCAVARHHARTGGSFRHPQRRALPEPPPRDGWGR